MTHWDQGAGRIPELNVYGPAHLARMTELIVGADGIFGPDLAARTQLRMSQGVFVARGGTLPRKLPQPMVREISSGEMIQCDGFTVEARAVLHAQPFLECEMGVAHGGSMCTPLKRRKTAPPAGSRSTGGRRRASPGR